MVDRVLEAVPGERLLALKNISNTEAALQGHFPKNPVFPGVLMLEAMAQTAGILGFITLGKSCDDDMLYLLAGIDGARFRRQAVPGDQLILEAVLAGKKRNFWRFDCRALVDNKLVAQAKVTCATSE